jgi:hypothetical protein
MALLYADENFDAGVVVELRRLGHDVRTVQEAGRTGQTDPVVLSDATTEGRAVLTFNRTDFLRLHRQSAAHAGILLCRPTSNSRALAALIDQCIAAAGTLAGQCVRVIRQPPPPRRPPPQPPAP